MLNSASKTAKFFYRDVDSTYPFWRLKTPEEHEAETNTKSKEARKYIFNCLDDIGQVNVPTDLEGQLLAEKTDRREFIDLLKRMLTIDQERRITPAEALNHAFTTLTHLVDYAHCNNVKASVQMMEVCRRGDFHTVQPTSTLNFVPNTTENMTFTINNQLSNQVQRLVRERPTAAAYDNLYQIYGSRNVGRQYANARADAFPHQLVSSILCQPGYQTMPSPTKHVVVGGPAPIPVQSQQYVNVPVPVSMVEPTSGQRMLLNRVQANTVAWPQGGARQVALVPSWSQQTAPHSLIVDSTPFLNMEEIYPKHHSLNMQRHDMKKESPIHHLVYVFTNRIGPKPEAWFIFIEIVFHSLSLFPNSVPRHDKKETNQLSPVKKRVKENSPPHQQRYNRAHVSPQYHHGSNSHNNYYNNNNNNGGSSNNNGHSQVQLNHHQTSSSSAANNQNDASNHNTHHHHHHHHHHGGSGHGNSGHNNNCNSSGAGHSYSNSNSHNNNAKQQQTITIHDTPSPTAVITISDSEDETPEIKHSTTIKPNSNQRSQNSSSSSTSCQSANVHPNQLQHSASQEHNVNNSSNSSGGSSTGSSRQQRKNVISCVNLGDSDTEERHCTPKHHSQQGQNAQQQNQNSHQQIKYEPHAAQSQKKRLLAMAQNECLLSTSCSASSNNNQLHVPKLEPADQLQQYDYPQVVVEKRASWAPPAHHNNHHKRESVQSYIASQQAAPPPMAHTKNSAAAAAAAAASWAAPMYRQAHQSNTPLDGSPGGVLPQDIYAHSEAMYRRPTVFVSQAPYQGFNRVVPPPAHNSSSRQVMPH